MRFVVLFVLLQSACHSHVYIQAEHLNAKHAAMKRLSPSRGQTPLLTFITSFAEGKYEQKNQQTRTGKVEKTTLAVHSSSAVVSSCSFNIAAYFQMGDITINRWVNITADL